MNPANIKLAKRFSLSVFESHNFDWNNPILFSMENNIIKDYICKDCNVLLFCQMTGIKHGCEYIIVINHLDEHRVCNEVIIHNILL